MARWRPWMPSLVAVAVVAVGGLVLASSRSIPARPPESVTAYAARPAWLAAVPEPRDAQSAELARAATKGELCSASTTTGVGLRGEYFRRPGSGGTPLLARTDSVVDFDSKFEWPAGIAPRPLSARWTGWVKPPLGGRYRFHVAQPGVRIEVARQLMQGTGVGAEESIELAAGRFYPITISAPDLSATKGRLRLEWTVPHGATYLVPRALLYLPAGA